MVEPISNDEVMADRPWDSPTIFSDGAPPVDAFGAGRSFSGADSSLAELLTSSSLRTAGGGGGGGGGGSASDAGMVAAAATVGPANGGANRPRLSGAGRAHGNTAAAAYKWPMVSAGCPPAVSGSGGGGGGGGGCDCGCGSGGGGAGDGGVGCSSAAVDVGVVRSGG